MEIQIHRDTKTHGFKQLLDLDYKQTGDAKKIDTKSTKHGKYSLQSSNNLGDTLVNRIPWFSYRRIDSHSFSDCFNLSYHQSYPKQLS